MASRFQRLAIQIKQTKSILADFVKSRKKCLELSQQLQQQISSSKLKYYQQLERQVQIKISILDHPGLINLKNKLTNALSDLLDIQHQLNYQYQRKKAKRQHLQGNYISQNNYKQKQRQKANVAYDPQRFDINQYKQFREKQRFKEKNNFKQQQQQTKNQKSRQQNQLPFYVIKNDTVQNKLDSISKFVASLKKSMKTHSEHTNQFKIRQYLQSQPQYMKIRQELQRFKMRQQQLLYIFQKKVNQQVQKYIKSCEVIEQTNQFKIIKIKKQQISKENPIITKKTQQNILDEQNKNILAQLGVDYDEIQQDKIDINQVRRRVDEDFDDIKRRLQQSGQNLQGIVQKINETVEDSELKLKQLRKNRKKMFIDDDIWDQMDKM